KAKAFAAWANLDANALKVGGSVLCPDAGTASQLAKQGETSLQEMKGQMGQFDMFLAQLPKTKQALQEFMDSTKYMAEGPVMMTTAQISRQTLTDVIQEFQGLAGNLQGGGFLPAGGIGEQPGGGGRPGGKGGMGPGGGKGGGNPKGGRGGRGRGGAN